MSARLLPTPLATMEKQAELLRSGRPITMNKCPLSGGARGTSSVHFWVFVTEG